MNYGGLVHITYFLALINDHRSERSVCGPRQTLQHEQRYLPPHADRIEYKVQWLNYHPSQATWESVENLHHVKEIVDKFNGQSFPFDRNERDSNSFASKGQKPDTTSEPMVLKRARGRPPKKPKSFGKL